MNMCSIYATILIILFSNSCNARLLYSDVNVRRGSAAVVSQENGEQWPSNVLLSRDQLLLARERLLNKSRDHHQRITSKFLADSESTRRRIKRKILRFDTLPQKKWSLPIKYQIDDDISGKMAP